jgi:hypothetical protein
MPAEEVVTVGTWVKTHPVTTVAIVGAGALAVYGGVVLGKKIAGWARNDASAPQLTAGEVASAIRSAMPRPRVHRSGHKAHNKVVAPKL